MGPRVGRVRKESEKRSRLRLIGKKIALARRLVSLLTCTQHLRLKYRIHAGLSSSPLPPPLSTTLVVTPTNVQHLPFSPRPLSSPPSFFLPPRCIFSRSWPVRQPFLHDPSCPFEKLAGTSHPEIPSLTGISRVAFPGRCCSSRKTR